MAESAPLQCQCGVTAFADIRFIEGGKLALTCFHCRSRVQVSVSAMMADLAWETMEREAPVPQERDATTAEESQARREALLSRAPSRERIAAAMARRVESEPEPEPTKPTGYKYSGLL